jgi:prepilin-type N-terminal cleavage/methylation domain-containing protein
VSFLSKCDTNSFSSKEGVRLRTRGAHVFEYAPRLSPRLPSHFLKANWYHTWEKAMPFFLKKEDGFTLAELALVLAIIGVIAGLSLPLLTHFKEQERKQITLKHQEIVLTALGTYVARHHQLPCPADPQRGRKQEGIARLSCNALNQTSSFGRIPFRTLAIPEGVTKDAYGHPMYYAVNPTLTTKDSYCKDQIYTRDHQPSLIVFDETGQPTIDQEENMPIAIVLFSEGEAYNRPTSLQEIENITPNLKFYTSPYAQNPEQPFRHFVTWASRDMLISYYGHSTCPKATLNPEAQPQQALDIMNEPDPLFQ